MGHPTQACPGRIDTDKSEKNLCLSAQSVSKFSLFVAPPRHVACSVNRTRITQIDTDKSEKNLCLSAQSVSKFLSFVVPPRHDT